MSTLTILNALADANIEAHEVEVIKNGCTCTGYQLVTGTEVRPVLYYNEADTIEAFVERAKNALMEETPEFNIEEILSRDNLLKNSYICLQKKSSEPIAKREYLNLEMFARVAVESDGMDGVGTIKIRTEMLKMAGVSEDELFEAAISNSEKKAVICSMAEALGLEDVMPEMMCPPFFVATYDTKFHGAGVLALNAFFHDFCRESGQELLYILPSSTEEVLILPGSEDMEAEALAAMVNEVNSTTVDPELQLEAAVYVYDDAVGEVAIAAAFNPDREEA